ncbi:MAG: DUF4442 domain-containing protein [Bacteroidetes bacterium]|nr:DUF4442 domain-containing protein [Bacteroidota bacterium]
MNLAKLQRQLWVFGLFKIPLIGFVRPKLIAVDDHEIRVKIRLRRRTRNHVSSMYLGVLTVGADLASGFLAFYLLENRKLKAAPVFGGMKAEYHKRAESDVEFVCSEGEQILNMIEESTASGERVTKDIVVKAICKSECVATFSMGLSIKVKSK